ncbi:MAG: DUF2207 domain-containing protein [Candidatus Krumholzibacteriota bacterium]|nr:DUF2207 domain-containing protein [Candidatus Krumholzibacteriota bacterium]
MTGYSLRAKYLKPEGIKRSAAPSPASLRVMAVSLILLGLLLRPGEVLSDAKSYYHPESEITVRLLPDGGAEVEEKRSFAFRGSFSWAQLVKEERGQYGRQGIEFLGVWDPESGRAYSSEKSSTRAGKAIKWFYSAQNTTRSFVIRYRVSSAVQRYRDAAQFYFKVIEDSHQYIGRLRVNIISPGPSPALFKVFIHSQARPGRLQISENYERAEVTQADIPANRFVELRVLLDPTLFSGAPVRSGQSHESLLEDERRITEEWRLAEQRRIEAAQSRARRIKLAIAAAILITLIFIAVYIYYFVKFGREIKVNYEGIYEREPPRQLPPCVLPSILTQSGAQLPEMGKAFAATLLECARLGYLEIHEKTEKRLLLKTESLVYTLTEKGKNFLEQGTGAPQGEERELIPFERDVLEAVFWEAGDRSVATSKEIEEWARETIGGKTKYYHFIKPRAKRLRKYFEREHFKLDDPRSEKAKKQFMGISVLLGLIHFALFLLVIRHPLLIASGVVTLLAGLFLSLPLARRTPEAALEYKKWKAFKKFMSDFSALKEAGPSLLELWEHFLVYATALGIADKLLSNLKLVAQEYGLTFPAVVWFHPTAVSTLPGGGISNLASLESLSSSISNLQNFSAALSSSSSSGGGFSGGGGGGGGGGSCSAG